MFSPGGLGRMNFSFEPQIINKDSAVPLRMITGGWIAGVIIIFAMGPVANRLIAIMGLSLLSGGLIALALHADRMWRMILGATAGSITAWLGFRFAFSDRLIPAVSDPIELANTDRLGAIALGLLVFGIGLGGVLEAVRAQASPGSSPLPVKVYLIFVGLLITVAIANVLGVSALIPFSSYWPQRLGWPRWPSSEKIDH